MSFLDKKSDEKKEKEQKRVTVTIVLPERVVITDSDTTPRLKSLLENTFKINGHLELQKRSSYSSDLEVYFIPDNYSQIVVTKE